MGIAVENIRKSFGSVIAVDDVTLTAADGELLAVVGPSGCGKTTLLRLIAGLESPDRGRVFIRGNDVTARPPEKRDVGIVFQHFALFPNRTVADNIGYGLRRRRLARNRRNERVESMLQLVGMAGLGGRRPSQLSAGQQQRVALARALAPEPETLLLDEPLSALDAAIREHLRTELKQMQRHLGITTIMVTHDQEEALAIADRVAVMNDGNIEQVGTPWDLYHGPETAFVARFIGRGNYFEGRADAEGVSIQALGTVPRRADKNLPPSGPVLALIRPEAVVLGTDKPDRSFTVAAHIKDVAFSGERSIVRLRLEQGAVDLVASVLSRDGGRPGGRIGERVVCHIAFDSIRWISD